MVGLEIDKLTSILGDIKLYSSFPFERASLYPAACEHFLIFYLSSRITQNAKSIIFCPQLFFLMHRYTLTPLTRHRTQIIHIFVIFFT